MHDNRPFCGSVDHAYAQVTLMWCPHEQAWTVMASSWLDTGRGDPLEDHTTIVRLGPFDGTQEAEELALAELRRRSALVSASP